MIDVDLQNDAVVAQELLDAIDKEQKEAFVIPKGEYEAVIVEYSRRDAQEDASKMFFGHTVWTTNWKLFDVNGKDRSLNFVNLCPTLVRAENGRVAMPCVLAGSLVKATGKPSLIDAMDEAKVNRMKLTVTVSKDGTKNYINKITKA